MNKKCALVTGAGRGIGRAIAIALANEGYDIGINYRSSEKEAKELFEIIKVKGVDAICIKGDVSKLTDVKKMFDEFFEKFGKIDLLVNNAGMSNFCPFLEVTEKFWEELVFTDFKGAFFSTQIAAKKMVEQKIKGSIINISSNHIGGCWPNATVYAACKAALTKFTENAAMELAKYGIRVNAIAPGYTDVGWKDKSYVYEAKDKLLLKRFAEPYEIADIVAFMASDKASYITGECMFVDGGCRLPIVSENDLI